MLRKSRWSNTVCTLRGFGIVKLTFALVWESSAHLRVTCHPSGLFPTSSTTVHVLFRQYNDEFTIHLSAPFCAIYDKCADIKILKLNNSWFPRVQTPTEGRRQNWYFAHAFVKMVYVWIHSLFWIHPSTSVCNKVKNYFFEDRFCTSRGYSF
jgi:hypothetical protein